MWGEKILQAKLQDYHENIALIGLLDSKSLADSLLRTLCEVECDSVSCPSPYNCVISFQVIQSGLSELAPPTNYK